MALPCPVTTTQKVATCSSSTPPPRHVIRQLLDSKAIIKAIYEASRSLGLRQKCGLWQEMIKIGPFQVTPQDIEVRVAFSPRYLPHHCKLEIKFRWLHKSSQRRYQYYLFPRRQLSTNDLSSVDQSLQQRRPSEAWGSQDQFWTRIMSPYSLLQECRPLTLQLRQQMSGSVVKALPPGLVLLRIGQRHNRHHFLQLKRDYGEVLA